MPITKAPHKTTDLFQRPTLLVHTPPYDVERLLPVRSSRGLLSRSMVWALRLENDVHAIYVESQDHIPGGGSIDEDLTTNISADASRGSSHTSL